MKNILPIFSMLLFSLALYGFNVQSHLDTCYISFKTPSNLTAAEPERRPESSGKNRILKTETGEVTITTIDGYRVLYNNEKKVAFVNLKVELTDKDSYETTTRNLLDNLKYQVSHSKNMESGEPIVMELNGMKIYGLSRTSIEAANTFGTFLMFPGNGIIVHFYFSNIKEGYRHFETVEEYRKLRDAFLNEYTQHLASCRLNDKNAR